MSGFAAKLKKYLKGIFHISKEKKSDYSVLFLACVEVAWGVFGFFLLLSAVSIIYARDANPLLLTNIFIHKLRESGLGGYLFFWPFLYLSLLPVGVGVFLRRNLARRLSLFIWPAALFSLFIFVFPEAGITLRKLRVLYLFSRILEIETEFWPIFFKNTFYWMVFVAGAGFLSARFMLFFTGKTIKGKFR